MFETLLKAAAYNMPVATAVASSFANYGLVPNSYDMMLYWWVPDPTFLRRGTWMVFDCDDRVISCNGIRSDVSIW